MVFGPTVPGIWEDRELYWQLSDRNDLAAVDRAKAKVLRNVALKIDTVLEGGAALKAGLLVGDIILASEQRACITSKSSRRPVEIDRSGRNRVH